MSTWTLEGLINASDKFCSWFKCASIKEGWMCHNLSALRKMRVLRLLLVAPPSRVAVLADLEQGSLVFASDRGR